ncbi:MAG: hypothetical protein ACI35O_15100 [Bacillaceae bacterium]
MGSVAYYTNCFKSVVLNNMVSGESCMLEDIYADLIDEINEVCKNEDEKEQFINNLNRAFESLHRDLVEVEELV